MNKGNELFHTHTYLFIHVAGDAQGRRSTPTSSGTSEMKVLFRTSGLRMFDPNGRSRPLVGPDDRLALIECRGHVLERAGLQPAGWKLRSIIQVC